MKKLYAFLIISAFIIPAFSQETKEPEKKGAEVNQVIQKVYTEIILEDFETTQFAASNLKFVKSKEQDGTIQIRDQYAAEFNNSKKYLGVKFTAKGVIRFRFSRQNLLRWISTASQYQHGFTEKIFPASL